MKFKKYTVEELVQKNMLEKPLDGNHGNKHPKGSDYTEQGIPFIMVSDISNGRINYNTCKFISKKQRDTLDKGFSKEGDVLLSHKATIGITCIVDNEYPEIVITPQLTYYRVKKGINNYYLKYYFDSPYFQHILKNWATSGSTRAYLGITAQLKLPILLPDIIIQNKIATMLQTIDRKIELNNQINDNLYNQAVAIYNESFKEINQREYSIGDYIVPKRGKNLLSRDAILGDVPVVAGGIEPATYHNMSNTKAPVITISASGANAGYINLWNIPVWSSDSSYIDNTITNSIYFWYLTLKNRQKEIFDTQTGSAQPHIYPKHIAELSITKLNESEILKYEKKVTPFFNMIGKNKNENKYLEQLRETLLPKLMNGEINLDKIEI